MRKLKLTSRQLEALYPPMPKAFESILQRTLQDLAAEKEQPIMKRRLSAALIVALILILISISAAIALTQSDLIGLMFGGSGQVPQELSEAISRPNETVSTADVQVALNEYLYDGEKLHLQWTASSISGFQVMVTMSHFQVNGKYLYEENATLFQSDDHTLAHVLGGTADDVKMPLSVSNFVTYANLPDADGPLKPGDTVEITCDLYIWKLLNPPILIDDSKNVSKGDYAKVKGLHRLPVDHNGLCILDQFVRDDGSVDADTGEDYRRAFEKLGWAKLTEIRPVRFTAVLEPKSVRQVQPTQTTFDAEEFTLVITRMAYMQTGGTLELTVSPKDKKFMDTNNPYFRPLVVLNADTMELLSGSNSYDNSADYAVKYQIMLKPVAGDMPAALWIAPERDYQYWKKDGSPLNNMVKVELKGGP